MGISKEGNSDKMDKTGKKVYEGPIVGNDKWCDDSMDFNLMAAKKSSRRTAYAEEVQTDYSIRSKQGPTFSGTSG